MSISGVSGPVPAYQVPQTPQAKSDDERTESVAIKQRESNTGKDTPVPAKKSAVDVKA